MKAEEIGKEEPSILIKYNQESNTVIVYTNFEDGLQTQQFLIEALRQTNIKLIELIEKK